MNFTQKKGKNEIRIAFKPEYINYYLKDESSKGEFKIGYEEITPEKYEYTEKNTTLKNYALYLLIIGVIFLAATFIFNVRTSFPLFLIGSLVVYVFYLFSVTRYTILDGYRRKIYIIHDKQHDTIINSIYKMRKDFMKKKYGELNLQSNSREELRRFQWLLEQEVITDKEFEIIQTELLGIKALSDGKSKRVN